MGKALVMDNRFFALSLIVVGISCLLGVTIFTLIIGTYLSCRIIEPKNMVDEELKDDNAWGKKDKASLS